MPLSHSVELAHVSPSAPSLHRPRLPESELECTQTPSSQSLDTEQTEPVVPSLHVPTKELAGKMHSRPESHWELVLHEVPASPVWHV